jgi:hypothetical protein
MSSKIRPPAIGFFFSIFYLSLRFRQRHFHPFLALRSPLAKASPGSKSNVLSSKNQLVKIRHPWYWGCGPGQIKKVTNAGRQR